MTTKMELNSIFKLVTKSGYSSIDVVKKAIRRYALMGLAKEMLGAVSEIDVFADYCCEKDRAVKAIRTNMINCLKTILFEEVSFENPLVFSTVCQRIKIWEDDGRTDRKTLADIVAIISHAKKLRLPIYLKFKYLNSECKITKSDFLDGIDNGDINCLEWIFHNDKEALDMLDEQDFPEKHIIYPMIKSEWKRLKPIKNRKGRAERFSFIIVPWLWILYNDKINEIDIQTTFFTSSDIQLTYEKTDIIFDIGENNKVENESDEWNFEDLKNNYNVSDKKSKECKPKRLRRGAINTSAIQEININVDDTVIIPEDVYVGRLPYSRININGEDKIINPANKGLNYGMDYYYVDNQKPLFGLNNFNMQIRKIRGKKMVMNHYIGLNEKGKNVRKQKYTWEDCEDGQIIVIMDNVDITTTLRNNKDILKNETMYREILKIRLFNGFFRTSDNILRNIVIIDDKLWGINENDIYGRRKNVFCYKEPMKKSEYLTVELVESVLDELNFDAHAQTLINEMPKYFPTTSCNYYENELRKRLINYKEIVMKELNLI
jgi:hypothetical protein